MMGSCEYCDETLGSGTMELVIGKYVECLTNVWYFLPNTVKLTKEYEIHIPHSSVTNSMEHSP
jgi:hypothetical protein